MSTEVKVRLGAAKGEEIFGNGRGFEAQGLGGAKELARQVFRDGNGGEGGGRGTKIGGKSYRVLREEM